MMVSTDPNTRCSQFHHIAAYVNISYKCHVKMTKNYLIHLNNSIDTNVF